MAGMGHNNGPTMEPGAGWRRTCWRKARAELLPHLPLNVVKRRVRRARELGLDYKAYASFRAATGRDIVSLLFSSNALRVLPGRAAPPDRAEHLQAITGAERVLAVHAPLDPEAIRAALNFDRAGPAPRFTDSEAIIRAQLAALRGRFPGDAVLLIGDTSFERAWCATGGFAGYLPAERYFGVLSAHRPNRCPFHWPQNTSG